jgi:hypothetical protein
MPKALLPIAACLLLCGGATAILVATNAQADSPPQGNPVLVALAGAPRLVDRAAPTAETGAHAPAAMMRERRAGRCEELSARAAGWLAYLEARLDLTAAQTPLFARWKNTRLAAARRMEQKCDTRAASGRNGQALTPVERLAHEQGMLEQRLADIEAERPALQALYGSLSEAQKERFGDGGRRMAMRMMRRMPHGAPAR